MESPVTLSQLLELYGQKQVLLDLANARIAAMERVAREHMAAEHPEPTPESEETPSDVDA